ncbi:MAG: WHG domain-containing protein [Clostridia bacterium]|nr:WHG domain-containing protein [Clostridia bacterium]
MPPKARIAREDIINTAVELVRRQGAQAFNARAVAAALNCSTQPVFSNFATMEELQRATLEAAYERYLGFLQHEAESGKYPKYKAYGMAYIRFAQEERELFKLLFMRDRQGEEWTETADWNDSVEMNMTANGLSREQAQRMHMELWIWVHGIAVMLATSYIDIPQQTVSDMMSDVYQGLRMRYTKEATV